MQVQRKKTTIYNKKNKYINVKGDKKMKRFKKNKKNKKKHIMILIILFILSIYTFKHNFINKKEIIIDTVIKDIKYNKSDLMNQYIDIDYILDNTLNNYEKTSYTFEEIEQDSKYNILIYNTHETEKYNDNTLSNYNIIPDVKMVSYILKDELNKYNINVTIVEENITNILRNNNWNYSKSYEASRSIITNYINNNNYNLIIDLHRDSSSLEKTLLTYNDIKYARTLFVVGTMHDNYQKNYDLSQKLNTILNNNIPNISRGISLKGGIGVNGIYNQDLSDKLILIELGGQYNEIEEINNTIKILSLSINKYLEEQ